VNVIKNISYKIYIGLSERTSKVLNNPEADRNGSKVYAWGPWAMSTAVGGWDLHVAPTWDPGEAAVGSPAEPGISGCSALQTADKETLAEPKPAVFK
jgi:hypothetical protein